MFFVLYVADPSSVYDTVAGTRRGAVEGSAVVRGSGRLPTGTVTLLLADVERSTVLWESDPDGMRAAVGLLDRTVDDLVGLHRGVRPVEQGEGDSFVVAFERASDALACALDLQRAELAPIRLRIGVHTGEVELRDEANYVGPVPNRAARLRDLAHGGQTVLSGPTCDIVADLLPPGAWLRELGSHLLRGLTRPERIVQLCHPDLPVAFPPLRTPQGTARHLPLPLTKFVGRAAEIAEVHALVSGHRLVTLTGAGGAGKTRLALEFARDVTNEFADGVWPVDLAPVTDPHGVALAVVRALGLVDQPGRSTMDTLLGFLDGRHALLVVDNCEHLLDACARLVDALLAASPVLTVLATSREPIGLAGEVSWRVPSLAVATEAVELFVDRARQVRPDYKISGDDAAAVGEICRRLDGIPLAIELAAARMRALSPIEIAAGLHDRFRLLTGGARTAVRRQQTLRASVDWSHALLTEPERILFRRLAPFMGGFDLDAAQAVAGSGELERHQVLDQLALLVDKSLVFTDDGSLQTRYGLLETVRQYAQEKLVECGEADVVRTRHCDHYTARAALLDGPISAETNQVMARLEADIDNLRAAFAWSRERSDVEAALRLASSLQPLWVHRGRFVEGRAWFDAALADSNRENCAVTAPVWARGLADKVTLDAWIATPTSMDLADQALAIARDVDDPALLARALAACGAVAVYDVDVARLYWGEAEDLARLTGDTSMLADILGWQAYAACVTGDIVAARAAGEEGLAHARAVGDQFVARKCEAWLALAHMLHGEVGEALARFDAIASAGEAAGDAMWTPVGLSCRSQALAYQGRVDEARAVGEACLASAAQLGSAGVFVSHGHGTLALVALAGGDAPTAASFAGRHRVSDIPEVADQQLVLMAEAALAGGDSASARQWTDAALDERSDRRMHASAPALTTSARVALAEGDIDRAEADAHRALAVASSGRRHLTVPDILECLAAAASKGGNHHHAARLCGAADAIRQRMGTVRFAVHQPMHDAVVAAARDALGDDTFEQAWSQGTAIDIDEAIAYAQRGRGQRKRPSSGWASLTPTERNVVRLVADGHHNSDIASRLLISPRTVQAHITHIYNKLGLKSRVQLAKEASQHS
jgi:predicted ATPase/class 3 adenylate cyclase/DNA-binding CsgD family transcriptional regulator